MSEQYRLICDGCKIEIKSNEVYFEIRLVLVKNEQDGTSDRIPRNGDFCSKCSGKHTVNDSFQKLNNV